MIETVITTALTALAGTNSAKKLGTDFADTIISTVRPWFLIDDDPKATEEKVAKIAQAVKAVQAESPTPPATEKYLHEELRTALTGHPNRIQQLQDLATNQNQVNVNNEGATIKNQFNNGNFNNTTFN
jgi:hypothetical protein